VGEVKMVCNHNDGWILKEEIVVDLLLENDNFEAEVVCNHLGCNERKRIDFT